jgi:hypothetical protein
MTGCACKAVADSHSSARPIRSPRLVASGRLPDGSFAATANEPSAQQRAELAAERPGELIAAIPRHLIPLPTPRRVRDQVLTRLNRFYTGYRLETVSSRPGTDLADLNGQAGLARPNGRLPDREGEDAAEAGQAEHHPGDVVVDDAALEPLDRPD